jgi:hypothetical protein
MLTNAFSSAVAVPSSIHNFKYAFSTRYAIEDLGPASGLLGCCIARDRGSNTLNLS